MINLYWIPLCSIVRRETKRFVRIWIQTLVSPTVSVALYFIVFGKLLGRQINRVHGFSYIRFITPGLIIMPVVTNAYSNVSSSFFNAKLQKYIEELLISPISWHTIVLGYVLGGTFRGTIVGILVGMVSSLFVAFSVHSWWVVSSTLALSAFLFASLGLLNALFAQSFDDINIVPAFVLTPMVYLGGVFYASDGLPKHWRMVSRFNPITHIVDNLRYGFLGMRHVSPLQTALVLVVCSALCYSACFVCLKKKLMR